MASSIRIMLRKKANKDGKFPIVIRITKNRKSSFIYIGQYIDDSFWDEKNNRVKKSHPNSARLNNLILKKMSEVNDQLLEVISDDKKASISKIKSHIDRDNEIIDFFSVADIHLDNLKDRKKFNQIRSEKGRLNRFKEFLKSESIPLENISVSVLKKFQAHLLTKCNLSPRSVVNYLILIRTIYNLAISRDFVSQKYYPFGKGKIQIKIPESSKIGLNQEEIKILEGAKLESVAQQHALNVWLISFYFAGIRIGDVLQLKWSDFIDDRLHYRMNKNQKLVTLKIPDKAKIILEKYEVSKEKKTDFVFPEMKKANMKDAQDVIRKIQTATRKFNNHYKKIAKKLDIDKNLSCHIARHSFANIAGNSINIQTLQKLYRHSSITTTINYQANFIHKDFDDALDSVVNF